MNYMLDTNLCIYVIANRSIEVVQKFRKMDQHDISVSVIVACELAYSVSKSQHLEKNKMTLAVFMSALTIDAMTDDVMWHYADLRCQLEAAGTRIGENDLWIAAHALANNAVLVTSNLREFQRVPGLGLENWLSF